MLHMKLEYRNGFLFVILSGLLDRDNSYKINRYLLPTILKQKIKNIVIDMDKVLKIDEYGIDALLNTKTAINCNKGKIYLQNTPENIKNDIGKLHIKLFAKEA